MWPSDPIFAKILRPIFVGGSPFQCLPEQVEREDARDALLLQAGFKRLFRCQVAQQAHSAVFIWVLDQPYDHRGITCEPSTIVNVEKTDQSISNRWRRYINALVKDWNCIAELADPDDLRDLADHDCNLSFFKLVDINFYISLHFKINGIFGSESLQNIFYRLEQSLQRHISSKRHPVVLHEAP